jgi:LacI family transcriptional regulator
MVRGIEDYLHPFGYTALLTNTDADPEREVRGLDALMARQVDGVIVAPTASNAELVKRMIDDGTPTVLLNRDIPRVRGFAVTPDDRRGAAAAVEHLVALGHRAIAHVGGPQALSPGRDRFRGFLEALDEHGLADENRSLAFFADAFAAGAGIAPSEALLKAGKAFTAVFAGNDLIALDTIDVLRAAGLSCPGDVSVIGFNDIPFADRFDPPLTTIRFSHYETGHRAAELLLEQIGGKPTKPRTVVLSTELIERGSTGPPPGDRESRSAAVTAGTQRP